jgi:hypothetical protein
MKTQKEKFKNYEELAHYWANNDCEWRGQTYDGRVFFDRDKIYSYGYHYVIAQKVRDKKGNVVFVAFNSNGYSNTTNKHKMAVRRALYQLIIDLPNADPYRPDVIADHFIAGAKSNLVASGKARIANREAYKARAAANIADWHTYTALMKKAGAKPYKLLKAQKLVLGTGGDIDLEAVKEAEEQAMKKAVADKKKRAKLLHAAELQILEDWKAGKREELPYLQTIYDTALRIYKGNVETSRNASVSVEAAKTLWKLIEAGRDVKGHTIERYTVISMNGVLKVGCHVIERTEVERIGQLLNENV